MIFDLFKKKPRTKIIMRWKSDIEIAQEEQLRLECLKMAATVVEKSGSLMIGSHVCKVAETMLCYVKTGKYQARK